ncbi:hypothetical protein EYW49_17285 [Siculibacillus lacustris]|uniref:Uncharacterized protein n=1 Tax=Siculibacillus lacustris TaxID=1549641 RepID=A0A4Q9VI34_9HYPH|nr:hypothetical protein [Siculibacillus lacustris]TBW34853.1 hypothetical protein EYW49_17285 [Siculibacillus lacustris]
MNSRRLPIEGVLVLAVAGVWAILAAVYQLSPSLGMPGYVRVWGAGAVVFLVLGGLLLRRRRSGD